MRKQEMWEEACFVLSLSETEKNLAKKLLSGPMDLKAAFWEYQLSDDRSLSPVFGHIDGKIFLYPVFACFVNGELPDSKDGSLPQGMNLEFPEQEEIYCGKELITEIKDAFQMQSDRTGEGLCFIVAGGVGAGFPVRQAAFEMARPLLFWDGNPASEPELLLTSALYDAVICLDIRKMEKSDRVTEAVQNLCIRGISLLVLAESAAQCSGFTNRVPVLFRMVPAPDEKQRETYIVDSLKKGILCLNKSQRNRLSREQFSIPVLKGILKELELEQSLCEMEQASDSKVCLPEKVFLRVLSRYKQNDQAASGIRRMAADRNLNDLCLPDEQHKKLSNICLMLKNRDKVMHQWGFLHKYSYGNGISILLYGAPGTGKTMAAQVIANELNMPLYRVDLSALISKYIGETQKNIAKIFDQAKQLNGILLFDEADALFSRRNEVSDAQDKYANAETAYLLQRIEESEGICILTTNLLQNFDEAFRRRITYMIHFPMPDEELREQIWQNVFPKEAPLDEGIDFHLLAESFELSGAAIRNAAVQSAWNASVEHDCIMMQDILQAVANEYRKMNKAMKPAQKALIELFD